MSVAATIDWTNVLVALIAGLPAIIAAVGVLRVHGKIKTPSGTSIGKQVEGVLHTALANNYHLRAIGGAVDAPAPPDSNAEAAKVADLPDAADTTTRPG